MPTPIEQIIQNPAFFRVFPEVRTDYDYSLLRYSKLFPLKLNMRLPDEDIEEAFDTIVQQGDERDLQWLRSQADIPDDAPLNPLRSYWSKNVIAPFISGAYDTLPGEAAKAIAREFGAEKAAKYIELLGDVPREGLDEKIVAGLISAGPMIAELGMAGGAVRAGASRIPKIAAWLKNSPKMGTVLLSTATFGLPEVMKAPLTERVDLGDALRAGAVGAGFGAGGLALAGAPLIARIGALAAYGGAEAWHAGGDTDDIIASSVVMGALGLLELGRHREAKNMLRDHLEERGVEPEQAERLSEQAAANLGEMAGAQEAPRETPRPRPRPRTVEEDDFVVPSVSPEWQRIYADILSRPGEDISIRDIRRLFGKDLTQARIRDMMAPLEQAGLVEFVSGRNRWRIKGKEKVWPAEDIPTVEPEIGAVSRQDVQRRRRRKKPKTTRPRKRKKPEDQFQAMRERILSVFAERGVEPPPHEELDHFAADAVTNQWSRKEIDGFVDFVETQRPERAPSPETEPNTKDYGDAPPNFFDFELTDRIARDLAKDSPIERVRFNVPKGTLYVVRSSGFSASRVGESIKIGLPQELIDNLEGLRFSDPNRILIGSSIAHEIRHLGQTLTRGESPIGPTAGTRAHYTDRREVEARKAEINYLLDHDQRIADWFNQEVGLARAAGMPEKFWADELPTILADHWRAVLEERYGVKNIPRMREVQTAQGGVRARPGKVLLIKGTPEHERALAYAKPRFQWQAVQTRYGPAELAHAVGKMERDVLMHPREFEAEIQAARERGASEAEIRLMEGRKLMLQDIHVQGWLGQWDNARKLWKAQNKDYFQLYYDREINAEFLQYDEKVSPQQVIADEEAMRRNFPHLMREEPVSTESLTDLDKTQIHQEMALGVAAGGPGALWRQLAPPFKLARIFPETLGRVMNPFIDLYKEATRRETNSHAKALEKFARFPGFQTVRQDIGDRMRFWAAVHGRHPKTGVEIDEAWLKKNVKPDVLAAAEIYKEEMARATAEVNGIIRQRVVRDLAKIGVRPERVGVQLYPTDYRGMAISDVEAIKLLQTTILSDAVERARLDPSKKNKAEVAFIRKSIENAQRELLRMDREGPPKSGPGVKYGIYHAPDPILAFDRTVHEMTDRVLRYYMRGFILPVARRLPTNRRWQQSRQFLLDWVEATQKQLSAPWSEMTRSAMIRGVEVVNKLINRDGYVPPKVLKFIGEYSDAVHTLQTAQLYAKIYLSPRFGLMNYLQQLNVAGRVNFRSFLYGFLAQFDKGKRHEARMAGALEFTGRHLAEIPGERARRRGEKVGALARWTEELVRVVAYHAGRHEAMNLYNMKDPVGIHNYAMEVVADTAFLYSAYNRPLAFKSRTARVIGQFQSYRLHYYSTLKQYWNEWRAGGPNAEEARKRFARTLAIGTVTAGTGIIPMYSVLEYALEKLGVFDGEDDIYREAVLRSPMDMAFSRILGIDFSTKRAFALGDVPDDPMWALGPTMADIKTLHRAAESGSVYDMVLGPIPRLRSAIDAALAHQRGYTTLAGEHYREMPNALESIGIALGLSKSPRSAKYELMEHLRRIYGDPDTPTTEKRRAANEWIRFFRKNYGIRLTKQQLTTATKSEQTRAERIRRRRQESREIALGWFSEG